ncbi:MAG: cell division protein FtsQ [Lachnospiraceae bacterium]|nr:cell division protein FtsQ [Lachnospiraceae bacterium]
MNYVSAGTVWKIIIPVMVLLIVLSAGYYYIISNYTVTTVYVEGNVHYTNEEIMDMVMEGYYGNNSLFLSFKYKDKSIRDVPFIEKMDVSVLDPHTIKIEVYEKALAGYVEYLDRYMYFDKDGIVVESSTEKTAGIPMVTGLSFDYVILYQPLPVEDADIFKDILSITQLVNKYDLSVSRIYFGSDATLTLYFENVRVALGNRTNLEEKIMKLQYMLPELEGKSGTLRMENYTDETKSITFEPD